MDIHSNYYFPYLTFKI